MFCYEQDITMLKNIKFKDGLLDTRIAGHPVLIILVTDTYFYYLTMSSSSRRIAEKHPSQYYALTKDNANKLRVPISYVNLKNVYQQEIANYIPRGKVKQKKYQAIIKNLKIYQHDIEEDNVYTRIKEYLWTKLLNSIVVF